MAFWYEKYNLKFGIQLKMSQVKVKISLVVVGYRVNICI